MNDNAVTALCALDFDDESPQDKATREEEEWEEAELQESEKAIWSSHGCGVRRRAPEWTSFPPLDAAVLNAPKVLSHLVVLG